jgi:hypothetical protein
MYDTTGTEARGTVHRFGTSAAEQVVRADCRRRVSLVHLRPFFAPPLAAQLCVRLQPFRASATRYDKGAIHFFSAITGH